MNQSHEKTICLTIDNLGEAAEIELGLLPPDTPTGDHVSIHAMAGILETLKTNGVQATFFVEGWNSRAYPQVLEQVFEDGHELALHGWCHERWADVPEDQELSLITSAFQAFRELGFDPVGFRPPGGGLTNQTEAHLSAVGATYISPATQAQLQTNKLVNLPFDWTNVDALWLEPLLAPVRELLLEAGEVRPLSAWEKVLGSHLGAGEAADEVVVLVFHPYILGQEQARMEAFDRFVSELAVSNHIVTARCSDVAMQGVS